MVPHNPSDESADVLLSRIHKEKVELAKDGKIKKKDLDVAPISAEEIPFEKPKGWAFARLSEISLDSADGPFGSNLKKEHYTDQKQVRIIQLSNIGELGWRDTNVKYTTFEHLKSISRSEAFAGDVIIAKMMPAGRAIICPDNDIKYVLSSDAVRFEFSSILDKRYLYYAINSPVFKEQVYGEVQGITRVRTSLSKLRTYILPIPPLSEQKAIVKKIEELFPLVDDYEKAAEELETLNKILPDKLRKSVLQEAIRGNLVPNDIPNGEATAQELLQQILKERQEKENKEKGRKAKKLSLSIIDDDLDELPGGWCWCRLSDFGECLYGVSESAKTVGQYKLLRITDIQNDNVNWETVPMSDYKKKDAANYLLRPGDLVFARTGGTVGKSYLINVVPDNAIYASYLIRVRFQGKALLPKYIKYFFQSPQYWSQVIENSEGTGQPNCNGTKLANLNIPLPPLSIQHRIVEKIEEVFATIDILNA